MKASVLISRVGRLLGCGAKLARVGFVLFLLCLPLFAAADPGVIAGDDGDLTAGLITEKFIGQKSISCNGQAYPIPSVITHATANQTETIYITISRSNCSSNDYRVDYGVTEYCEGQNFCSRASFSSTSLSDSAPSTLLSKLLDLYARKIPLDKGLEGYFIPSQCFSYCNQAQLAWYHFNKIYVAGIKDARNSAETIDSLRAMANSFILGRESAP